LTIRTAARVESRPPENMSKLELLPIGSAPAATDRSGAIEFEEPFMRQCCSLPNLDCP
jgi:hypothetical protein